MQTKGNHSVRQRLTALLLSPGKSVQSQMMMVFVSVILLLLLVINTYPVMAMRNVVYGDKEQSMSATVSVVSSALSGLDTLTAENVGTVTRKNRLYFLCYPSPKK